MPFQPPEPIEAERVRVRLLAEPDLPALFAVNSDDAVTALCPTPHGRRRPTEKPGSSA